VIEVKGGWWCGVTLVGKTDEGSGKREDGKRMTTTILTWMINFI
jgi:hypothetical protein